MKQFKIDVVFVSETFLNAHHSFCSPSGYRCIRLNRVSHRGGVLAYVRTEIDCSSVLDSVGTVLLKAASVVIRDKHQHAVTQIEAYLPGAANTRTVREHLEDDIEALTRGHSKYFF